MYSIDSARVVNWGDYCGIPGGIPSRTTVYQTLTTSNSLEDINTAIANCTSGQVVYLDAGTYSIGAVALLQKSGITIRGAGAGQTIIDTSSTSSAILSSNVGFSNPHGGDTEAIASGYTKGSTAIVLADTPPAGYAAGNLIQITQDDDYDLVWHRTGNWAGSRNLRFTTRITSVSGTTINLAVPIPYTYQADLSPQSEALAPGPSLLGIENLSIYGEGAASCVHLYAADRCWLKDVELRGSTDPLSLNNCSQCEIRRCYIHDVDGFPDQSDGYGVRLDYGCSSNRVEDCVGYHLAMLVMANSAASNAILYNYDYYNGRIQASGTRMWVMPTFNCNHGPHSIMNLWEGNICERFQNDGYHGSASHQTLFRNNINGVHPTCSNERQLLDLCRASYYHNVVGNVLGDSTWNPTAYEASGAFDHAYSCIYCLGYPNMDNSSLEEETAFENWTAEYPDASVSSTLLRHANYDYHGDEVKYADGADTDIPDSLFYDSKPSYFGSLSWPTVEPVGPVVNDNPAKDRWDDYVASETLSDLFADQPSSDVTTEVEVELTVTSTEEAALWVEYPLVRVVSGTSATYEVHALAYNGFVGDITLDTTGLPANATDSYGANPIAYNGSTTVTITTTDVAAGTYSLDITGVSDGGNVASIRVVLEIVESADVALKVPVRKVRAKAGDNAVFSIEAASLSGYTSDTNLSVTGLPTGASASFGDSSLAYNGSTTMTVDTGTAAAGTYELTITGEEAN